MMKKILAIGGGEMGGTTPSGEKLPDETRYINKELITLSGKKNPRLLFIPTASNDSERYSEHIHKYFTKLGAKVDVLYLINKKISKNSSKEKILSSDIIYVGGGNTLQMMNVWKKHGVDKVLKKAYNKGIVLSGLSAGSICWFKYGNSDSRKFKSNSKQLIKVTGLGLINALHCPHYHVKSNRQQDLKRMMKTTYKIVAITLDNCCALEFLDDKYRIIKSKPQAKAYKVYWKEGKYHKEEILSTKEYQNINTLLKK